MSDVFLMLIIVESEEQSSCFCGLLLNCELLRSAIILGAKPLNSFKASICVAETSRIYAVYELTYHIEIRMGSEIRLYAPNTGRRCNDISFQIKLLSQPINTTSTFSSTPPRPPRLSVSLFPARFPPPSSPDSHSLSIQ